MGTWASAHNQCSAKSLRPDGPWAWGGGRGLPPTGGAHLPQQAYHPLGPGGHVLHARRAEQLHQGLHGVAGVDVVGPLGGEAALHQVPTARPEAPAAAPTPSSQGEPGAGKEARHPQEGLGLGGWALRPGGAGGVAQGAGPRRPHEGVATRMTPTGKSQEGRPAEVSDLPMAPGDPRGLPLLHLLRQSLSMETLH